MTYDPALKANYDALSDAQKAALANDPGLQSWVDPDSGEIGVAIRKTSKQPPPPDPAPPPPQPPLFPIGPGMFDDLPNAEPDFTSLFPIGPGMFDDLAEATPNPASAFPIGPGMFDDIPMASKPDGNHSLDDGAPQSPARISFDDLVPPRSAAQSGNSQFGMFADLVPGAQPQPAPAPANPNNRQVSIGDLSFDDLVPQTPAPTDANPASDVSFDDLVPQRPILTQQPPETEAAVIRQQYLSGRLDKTSAMRLLSTIGSQPDKNWMDEAGEIAYPAAKATAEMGAGLIGGTAGTLLGGLTGPAAPVAAPLAGMAGFAAGQGLAARGIDALENYLSGQSDTFRAGVQESNAAPVEANIGQTLPLIAMAGQSAAGYLKTAAQRGLAGVLTRAGASAVGMPVGQQIINAATGRGLMTPREALDAAGSGLLFGGSVDEPTRKAPEIAQKNLNVSRTGSPAAENAEGLMEAGINTDSSPEAVAARATDYLDRNFESLLKEYERRFGNNIDLDKARELFPEYSRSKEARTRYVQAVGKPALKLINEYFERKLADPSIKTVAVIAGGTGSGKSEAGPLIAGESGKTLVFETTLSNFEGGRRILQKAFNSGKRVVAYHVARPFPDAWNSVINRAVENGRPVPLDVAAQQHADGPGVSQRLAALFGDKVEWRAIDNSHRKGEATLTDPSPIWDRPPVQAADLAKYAKKRLNEVYEQRRATKSGISPELYRALAGK